MQTATKRTSLAAMLAILTIGAGAEGATWYVSRTSPFDGPGTNLAYAFHTIQAGVDAAADGDTVLVAEGLYDQGGKVAPVTGAACTNRVCITKPITVRSVYGAAITAIWGAPHPVSTNGPAAVRCVYMQNGTLDGFTLVGGHTGVAGNDVDICGGGIFLNCNDATGTVRNCLITRNSCHKNGGGVSIYSTALSGAGRLIGCTISGNMAATGAGGGVDQHDTNGEFRDCVVTDNKAYVAGGGAGCSLGLVSNCVFAGNIAITRSGGGVLSHGARWVNCLIESNRCATTGGGIEGDGVQGAKTVVENCTVRNNNAGGYRGGGGNFSDTLCRNTLFSGNRLGRGWGGGVYVWDDTTLENCTVAGNSVSHLTDAEGGGLYVVGFCRVTNSIIYANSATRGANWSHDLHSDAGYSHVCTSPTNNLPGGAGCIAADPLFVAAGSGNYRLQSTSPCVETGTNLAWMVGARDLDDYSRLMGRRVDMGAYEVMQQDASPVHYASLTGGRVWPYTNWVTAAQTIQEAVNAASNGTAVVVSNGVYSTDGAVVDAGGPSNRVALTRAVTVRSVNGPQVTTIEGAGPVGTGAVRCAYLRTGATLSGFTLENGHTLNSGDLVASQSGGGALLDGGGTVSNCTVIGNTAVALGGGLACSGGGDVYGCAISNNMAIWGGGFGCTTGGTVRSCTVSGNRGEWGGGAMLDGGGTVSNCIVIGNTATDGGGIWCEAGSLLYNCAIAGNAATRYGGGVVFSEGGSLRNCTVSDNSAAQAGGVAHYDGGSLWNTIVYFNQPDNWFNVTTGSHPPSYRYCCTTPTRGTECVTDDPAFAWRPTGDYRLRNTSSCIGKGGFMSWMTGATDLGGKPRIIGTAVDIGAHEFDPAVRDSNGDGVPDEWCAGYDLDPYDPDVALANPDRDPATTGEEYLADTNPTNATSYLRITAFAEGPPHRVYFAPTSVRRVYTLLSRGSLTGGGWSPVPGKQQKPGNGSELSLPDTRTTPSFYGIGAALAP